MNAMANSCECDACRSKSMGNPETGQTGGGDLTKAKHIDPRRGSLAFPLNRPQELRAILSQISGFPNRKAAPVEPSEASTSQSDDRSAGTPPGGSPLEGAAGRRCEGCAASRPRTTAVGKNPGSKSSRRNGKDRSIYWGGLTRLPMGQRSLSTCRPRSAGPQA
jgi:hypothetical protein